MNSPDRFTADLRRYEAEQDKLEREAPTKKELLCDAAENLREDEKLAAFLEDDFIAAPLARMFRNLEGAIGEMSQLYGNVRAPCLEAILQAVSRLEKDLSYRMIEEL